MNRDELYLQHIWTPLSESKSICKILMRRLSISVTWFRTL
jgi:hypothetical protein